MSSRLTSLALLAPLTLLSPLAAAACSRGEGMPPESATAGRGGAASTTTGGRAATGGSNSTGGTSMGGAPSEPPDPPIQACADAVATGENPLIDDFEDGDTSTLAVDGRHGGTYPYDDGTNGVLTLGMDEIDGGRGGSTRALHTTGVGFEKWGAGFAIALHPESTDENGEVVSCYYDASVYAGVRFWARGNLFESDVPLPVRAKITMVDVIPVADGGTCDREKGGGECYDDHGLDLTLTPEWTEYELPFATIEQAGWGQRVGAFNPARIWSIQFATDLVDYDYWIDDISFY